MPVHRLLREAFAKKGLFSLAAHWQKLNLRQSVYRGLQGRKGFLVELAIFLTMLRHEGVQRHIATIFQQIGHSVFRHSQHLRHRKTAMTELAG